MSIWKYLRESFHTSTSITVRTSYDDKGDEKYVEIFENPTSKELRSLPKDRGMIHVRFGVTDDGKFFGWRGDVEHHHINFRRKDLNLGDFDITSYHSMNGPEKDIVRVYDRELFDDHYNFQKNIYSDVWNKHSDKFIKQIQLSLPEVDEIRSEPSRRTIWKKDDIEKKYIDSIMAYFDDEGFFSYYNDERVKEEWDPQTKEDIYNEMSDKSIGELKGELHYIKVQHQEYEEQNKE